MPENTSSAIFTDQLEITVDLGKFKQSLDEARQIYTQFVNSLGDAADKVLSVGMVAGLKQQIETFVAEAKVVSETALKIAQETQQGISAIAEVMGEKAQQAAEREIAASNKAAEVKIANEKKVAEAKKQSAEEQIAIDRGQINGKQVYGVPNLDGSERQTVNPALKGDPTGIVQDTLGAVNKLAEEYQKLDAEAKKYFNTVTPAGEAEIAERKRLIEKQAELERSFAPLLRQIDAEKKKWAELNAEARAAREAGNAAPERGTDYEKVFKPIFDAADKVSAAKKKIAEDIDLNIQGANDQRTAQLEKNAAALNTELEKTGTLLRKIEQASFGKDLTGQIGALKQRLAEVSEQAVRLRSQLDKPVGTTATEAQVAAQKALNRLLQEEADLRNKINSTQSKMDRENRTFFDRLGNGWASTASHMIRVVAIMQVLMTLMDAAREAITAPFKAIAEGLKYTRETEREADLLMGVLAANIKYSDDLAANYDQLRKAAEGAVRELQNIAVYVHAPIDSVERTFKSLMDNGITKFTANMHDVLTMTTMFAAALRVAGLGGLQLNQEIGNIPKLMDGTVGASNRFLRVLNLTPAAWQQILDKAKVHHDLITRLAPLMDPFMSALEKGKAHQAVLIEQFELLKKRLEAFAVTEVYERLSDAIKGLNDWMQGPGGASVIAFLKMTAEGVLSVATSLYKLAESFKIFDVLKVQLLGLLGVLQSVQKLLADVSNTIQQRQSEERTRSLEYQLGAATGDLSKKGIVAGEQLSTSAMEGDSAKVRGLKTQLKQAYLDYLSVRQKIVSDKLLSADMDEALANLVSGKMDPKVKKMLEEWSNALNGLFTDQSRKDAKPMDLRPLIEGIQEAWQAYQNSDENIKEASDQARRQVQNDLAAQVISHKEAAEQIREITQTEMNDRNSAWVVYKAEYNRLVAEINAAPASDKKESDQKQARLHQLNMQLERERRSVQKEQDSANDRYLTALRAANTEEDAIRRAHTQFLLSLAKEQAKAELAIQRQRYQDGYLTATEFFAKEEVAARTEHEQNVKILQAQMDALGTGPKAKETKEYKEFLDRLEMENEQYNDRVELQTLQRLSLIERERVKREEFYDRLRELNIEAMEMVIEVGTATGNQARIADLQLLYTIKEKELEQLKREKQLQLDIAKARNSDSEAVRKLVVELQALSNQEVALYAAQVRDMGSRTSNPFLNQMLVGSVDDQRMRELQRRQSAASDAFSGAVNSTKGRQQTAEETQAISALAAEYLEATKNLSEFKKGLDQHQFTFGQSVNYFTRKLLGFDWDDIKATWKRAVEKQSDTQKAGVIASVVKGVAEAITNIGQTWSQGKQSGGTMGGIGALMGAVGGAIPGPWGQVIGAVGSVLGMVGSLFTAAAKKIAEDAKKKFQETIDALHAGNATLIQTINSLEEQRMQTIMKLSGKKGGQDQLDQLLPDFDKQIASLKRQADDIITAFNTMLRGLNLHSDTLMQITQQWEAINKQVKDYIGAGGDALKAEEYLSLQLEKMQLSAKNELNSAEETAIQDAMQLNDLLKQRNRLEEDYNKKVFDLQNADAIERRQSGAATRASQIAQAKQDFEAQRGALDSQITLTSKKVELEREVFNIAGDTATLQQRSNELTLASLVQQISKWKDLKSIVESISVGANGLFTAASVPFFPSLSIGSISITVSTPSIDDLPEDIGDSVANEILRKYRYSPSLA
jgi:hypothetical protein